MSSASSTFEVVVSGIETRELAQKLAEYLSTPAMPESISVVVRRQGTVGKEIHDAVEHFLDPEAGAYGHEDRDSCRAVLEGLLLSGDSGDSTATD